MPRVKQVRQKKLVQAVKENAYTQTHKYKRMHMAQTYTYIGISSLHTYIQPKAHPCKHVCIHRNIKTCKHLYTLIICTHLYTHNNLHDHVHTYMYIHLCGDTQTQILTHVHILTKYKHEQTQKLLILTHMCAYVHMPTHTPYTRMHTYRHTTSHIQTDIITCTHSFTHQLTLRVKCIHIHAHMQTMHNKHTQKCTLTHSHDHIYTHRHSHIYTHRHTYKSVHIYTHARLQTHDVHKVQQTHKHTLSLLSTKSREHLYLCVSLPCTRPYPASLLVKAQEQMGQTPVPNFQFLLLREAGKLQDRQMPLGIRLQEPWLAHYTLTIHYLHVLNISP